MHRRRSAVRFCRAVPAVALLAFLLTAGSLSGCQQAAATPAPYVAIYVTPTPKPTRTLEQAVADATTLTLNSPTFLSSQHLARGARCQSCHDPYPPTKAPTSAPCLACHGGSEERLAALRNSQVTQWHKMHLDITACAACHYGHEKFEVGCVICHPGCTLH